MVLPTSFEGQFTAVSSYPAIILREDVPDPLGQGRTRYESHEAKDIPTSVVGVTHWVPQRSPAGSKVHIVAGGPISLTL
jgi:hypothetical protein